MTRYPTFVIAALIVCVTFSFSSAEEFEVTKTKAGVTVKYQGELFTNYVIKSGAKPILWPVIGPTGKEMTRQYPMRDALKTEKGDHIHHRSLWFTHGDVNGVSFWHENDKHGNIIHRAYGDVRGGKNAVIETQNDWVDADGKKLCEDSRVMGFGAAGDVRWIDFEITITASEGDVTFGDTKEGCFGVRTAGTMKVDSKLGGKIINSRGDSDKNAWGKQAEWVDYYGPVEGETAGIAIFDHPSSFRYPSHWHVRTYGLFAANPFGLSYFVGKSTNGAAEIKKGKSIKFHYRVLLHKGTTEQAKIAERYKAFSK